LVRTGEVHIRGDAAGEIHLRPVDS
jgi:hypothetical protein